ncbi:DNA ligase-1 [Streptomyces turgidiscabies]|uniref:Probable DNA ligase n=2 Tax=Streptomyces turgidiscabies TaxID=85558 RepID=A0ABU0RV80_9ACTN|nr:DNA ligase-1 [Streptomyces turgidiscabies]
MRVTDGRRALLRAEPPRPGEGAQNVFAPPRPSIAVALGRPETSGGTSRDTRPTCPDGPVDARPDVRPPPPLHHDCMLLTRLAHVSREVAATSARSHKIALLAELFRDAGPDDVPIVIPYLAGRLPQGRLGIGWKVLDQQVPPAAEPSLTVLDVDARLTAIGAVTGAGSQAERGRLVRELLAAATADEQRFLFALITGEVRQGALDAVAVEGLAAATEAPPADVRRAVMLAGAIQPVAQALLADGPTALARFRLTVGRPVLPMLAHSAASVAEAVEKLGACAVEEKLDGIRVQVHRDGDDVRLYTRTLDDITDRLPELTTAARTLRGERFILDGEVIAFDTAGRPRSFQETAGRVGSRVDVETAARDVPVSPVFFDALSVDGHDLLDLPFAERHTALARLVPEPMRVRRLLAGGSADLPAAEEFLADTLARGHEGVVVKALDAPYSAGRRGAAWLKVKPVHTLDLVVLAAEWGHGRRTGKLSNLHLGARNPDGSFAMLGKTFKGMTDAMLTWQTERLQALAVSDDGWVVTVRPELVVEIAYDGLQRSTRYPAGVTLRFARVVRYREDKTAEEADTVQTLLAAHPEVAP